MHRSGASPGRTPELRAGGEMQAAVRSCARVAGVVAGAIALSITALAASAATEAVRAATQVVPSAVAADTTGATAAWERAALVVYGDTIAWFLVPSAGVLPTRRAVLAHDRLEALGAEQMRLPVRAEPLEDGHMVLVGDMFTFMFKDDDAPFVQPARGETAVEAVRRRLSEVLSARAAALRRGLDAARDARPRDPASPARVGSAAGAAVDREPVADAPHQRPTRRPRVPVARRDPDLVAGARRGADRLRGAARDLGGVRAEPVPGNAGRGLGGTSHAARRAAHVRG